MDAGSQKHTEAKKPKGRQPKPLIDETDVVMSIKRVLDQMLLESSAAPHEIREKLVAARNACWERFKKDEEALNARTS